MGNEWVKQSAPHVLTCDILNMEVGKVIRIKARVSLHPASFAVNLKCDNGDIAFHFNPRFDVQPQVVVCNTNTEDKWGEEERNHQMPFRPGEPFEMTITIQNDHYEVSVNGKHYLTYDHRLPFHVVKKMEFLGDINFEENGSPLTADPIYSPFTQNDFTTTVICDPKKETPKLPTRDDTDKTPRTEIQYDYEDDHEPDQQSERCCFCRLFVKPQWIKCTRWKMGGEAAIQVDKIC